MRRVGALTLSVALAVGTLAPAASATTVATDAGTPLSLAAGAPPSLVGPGVPLPLAAGAPLSLAEGSGEAQGAGEAQGEGDAPRAGEAKPDQPYDTLLDGLVENEPTGGVLAARTADGEHVRAARGVADQRTGREARPHDRYRIGSNTKTMTAVVVLQLVEEGRLSLDDAVADLLPRLDLDPRITVRHLLQHTSGFRRETMLWQEASAYERHRFRYFRPAELVRIALTNPEPRPEPGTEWEYSNTNYVLAGMVVREVTGNSLRRELNRRVLRPAKLRHTSFPVANPFLLGRHLRGYYTDGSDTTTYSMSYAWAAGNVISTAGDQSRFLRALLDGDLLRPDTLRTMLDPGEFGYGLGILPVRLPCGGMAYGHDGAVFGYQSANLATRDGRTAAIGVNAWMLDEDTGALSPAVVRAAAETLCVQAGERPGRSRQGLGNASSGD